MPLRVECVRFRKNLYVQRKQIVFHVSTERYSSVWYDMVPFGMVPLDLARVITTNCTRTWLVGICQMHLCCAVPQWCSVTFKPVEIHAKLVKCLKIQSLLK